MNMDRVSVWMAIAGITIIGIVCMTQTNQDDRKEFMRECQDSGVRHFQCSAMWRGGAAMLILPVDVN